MSGGIVRGPRPESQFDQIERKTVREERLSYRARGVLFRLLSNVDGFSMTATELANQGVEGRGAILSALKELRSVGYLVTTRVQDKQGRWSTSNVIFDQPQIPIETHVVEKPKFKNRIPVSRISVDRMPVSSTVKAEKTEVIPAAAAVASPQTGKIYFSRPEFGEMEQEVGNERDFKTASSLTQKYSLVEINRAVNALALQGKRGLPSNVLKFLGANLRKHESHMSANFPKSTPRPSKTVANAELAKMKITLRERVKN